MDDLHHLRRNVLVYVVGDGNPGEAVADEGDGDVNALQQALGVDAAEDEAAFVEGFGALGAGADANGRERMADAGEERGLLRQRTTIRHHCEGIHLQAIVVVETQWLVLDDAAVKLEAAGLQTLTGARVAGVQDRHIVLLRHLVDRVEKAEEILLRVDVLLAMGAQQDVLSLLQPKPGVDVAGLDLSKIGMQYLRHRGTCDISPFLGQAAFGQVTPGMFRIGHIHIGNDVHNAAVGLFRQAFVLAAVARLHVEDGDVEALGADDAKATVGVAQHQDGIRLHLHHQLVALGDDVAHGFAEVIAHGLHIHVRVSELQVLEEHPVKVIIIVLPRVRQQAVEILPAFVDDGRQPDDFRTRADDDEKLELTVIFELCPIFCLALSACNHISGPSVAQIPMLVIDELEIRKREFLLNQLREFVQDGLGPMTDQNDELVDIPCHASARDLGIIPRKLCLDVFGLGLEILLRPDLPMQPRIVDERNALLGSLLHFTWCDFLLVDPKEALLPRVIPEDTHGGHRLVK